MKKITNFRLLFFSAIFLCLGIWVESLFVSSAVFCIVIPIAVLTVGILLSVFTKKHSFWVICLVFLVGSAYFITDYALTQPETYTSAVTVEGRVCEINGTNDTILLENVRINGNEIKGYVYGQGKGLAVGDEIVFTGEVETCCFGEDSFDKYLYSRRIDYRTTVENYTVQKSSVSLSDRIRKRCQNAIEKYASEEETGVIMCLLFGDKSMMGSSVYEYAGTAGISHIFAVSGLHVGFVTSLLYFCLRKIKVPKKITYGIIFLALIFYGYLTGFPAGVVRSSVFFILYAVANLTYRKGDGLSILGASALLILLVDPRQLFDISFLMSFGAVAGICLFYQPFYSIVFGKVKNRFVLYFGQIVSVTVSANVFLIPLTASVFSSVSVYAVFSNMVVLPMISIVFPVLVIAAFLATVYDGFGILFYALKYPIFAINVFTKWLSSLPYASVSVSAMGISSIFYILFFLWISKLNLTKPVVRFTGAGVLATVTVLTLIFA